MPGSPRSCRRTANEDASRSVKTVPYAAVLSARGRPPATQILFGNGDIRVSLDSGEQVAVTSASISTQALGVAEPHQCRDSNRAVRTRRGPVCSPDHTPTSFILRYQEALFIRKRDGASFDFECPGGKPH